MLAGRPMLISLSDHVPCRATMSKQRSSTATVTDVAQLAGVSVATVSRILNGAAQVTADKRAAVEEAIHKLQFRPNLSARSLRSGSTQTIGILTQEFESPYFIAGTKGVESGLEGSGYTPLVVPGHWNPQEELDRARLLMARRVDAIVILGGTLSDAQLLDMARQQPIAITGRQLQGPQLCAFHADQVAGGLLATRHLIELGHRAIAHIAGPADHPDAIERKEGFLAAHREANLSVDPRLIVAGDYMEQGGEQAAEQLLAQGVPFSAIFCANDLTLWGARLALHRHGVRVPEDCSLVGFDDIPASRYMTPPVTSVRQPIHQMGRLAAEALLGCLRGEPMGAPQMLPLELVVRGTTAQI
jgi:LacI family transcriptional regulator